ncbi:MAG: hypothetical protein QGG02_01410 [Gammaproteobacteria bacterium]|jgi:hypothetical protein|nr:hypothetical protein [Gammaproteobacteria bacterium]MDP6734213.1 hypothetical protein [Gammaproteobacteria bacterium]
MITLAHSKITLVYDVKSYVTISSPINNSRPSSARSPIDTLFFPSASVQL